MLFLMFILSRHPLQSSLVGDARKDAVFYTQTRREWHNFKACVAQFELAKRPALITRR